MNVELGMARTSRRLRDAAQDPRNSPNGFKPSKRSQTALTIIKIGTPSSKPKTPQSQPQASNPTNTATGLSWLLRLVSQGVSKLPTSVWIPRETPQMTRAMSREPTCKKSDRSRCGCRDQCADIRRQVQDTRHDAQDCGVLQALRHQRQSGEHGNQRTRENLYLQVALDWIGDFIEYLQRDLPAAQARSGQLEQLASKAVA